MLNILCLLQESKGRMERARQVVQAVAEVEGCTAQTGLRQ